MNIHHIYFVPSVHWWNWVWVSLSRCTISSLSRPFWYICHKSFFQSNLMRNNFSSISRSFSTTLYAYDHFLREIRNVAPPRGSFCDVYLWASLSKEALIETRVRDLRKRWDSARSDQRPVANISNLFKSCLKIIIFIDELR